MSIFPNLSRRAFLASQAALAAVTGLPAVSIASSAKAGCAGKHSYVKARWDTATAEELSQYVGERFSVRTEGYGDIVMRLTSVDSTVSGPHRPGSLARREGVTAIFESPDMEPLVRAGHQTYCVRHTWLGSADLFMGPVPKRDGGHVVELILNQNPFISLESPPQSVAGFSICALRFETRHMHQKRRKIEFRVIDNEDQAFLFRVYASTREWEFDLTTWTEEEKQDFLKRQFRIQDQAYKTTYLGAVHRIIQFNGEDIGRLYVDRQDDHMLIIDLTLLPEHRGHGIGTDILRSLLYEAQGGKVPVRLHVEQNSPALTLYLRHGFRKTGVKGHHFALEWQPDLRPREI